MAPPLHQGVDQARLGEGRGVAQACKVVLGDLSQDATHDLAAARLGQRWGEVDEVGAGDGADLRADVAAQLRLELGRAFLASVERDVDVDAGALDVVRVADDGGFGDLGVADQGTLDLGGAEPVAGNVEHVVDAAGDPVIAVRVPAVAVAGEIFAAIG